MLKIKTRFISAVMSVVVAVTAAFGGAFAVSAEDKTLDQQSKPYTLGTKVGGTLPEYAYDNFYSFNLTVKTTLTANIKVANPYNDRTAFGWVFRDSTGNGVSGGKYVPIEGNYNRERNVTNGKTEGNVIYENLLPGKYYFAVLASRSDALPYELTISPEQFTPGVVAPNVITLVNTNTNSISVNWGDVPSAQYAVYYTYRNAAGAFSKWGIASTNETTYTIPNITRNVTYYITVLPYSNVPSRQYGGFAPYAITIT